MAFTALAAGVSGLQAFTESVGVIADNITNVNTVGYKETRSRFSTLVTETGNSSSYSPGGVRAFAETLVSKQGLLQSSSSSTDLAVDGAGFFAVRKADDAQATNGELLYTRSGAFTQDDEGFLKNTAGLYLLGWDLESDGTLSVNKQETANLEPIRITGLSGFSEATSRIDTRINLQASTPISGAYTNPEDLASGSVTPDFETNVQIFDSLGREHTVVMAAAKTGANTWSYEYYFDDPSQLNLSTAGNGMIAYGELAFNSDGTIDYGSTTMFDEADTAVTVPDGAVNFDYATVVTSGADAVTVDQAAVVFGIGSDNGTDGFTQFDSSSSLLSSAVDGAKYENVNGISIDEDGIVSALFDNGLSLKVFKLPVATFDNPDGLQRRQGNAYGASDDSGDVVFNEAGGDGAGTIAPNALEQSTVDLANEFSELIKVQRAFSASTRIITTSDQILEELTRL